MFSSTLGSIGTWLTMWWAASATSPCGSGCGTMQDGRAMYMMNQSSGIRNRSFLLPRVSFVAVMFLLAILASSSVAQQMANAPQLGTISGAVYRATNNDIVRGVLITLEAQDGTTTNYRAFTDNDGHFTVRAVRAGKY